MTEDDQARLARRYPRPRPNRWWVPVAIALALVGAAWLVWAGGHGAAGVVTGRVDAFDVRSDTLIEVTVSIDRPDPSRAGECKLYAQAVSYDRVGETVVRVDPGDTVVATRTVELRTFKRATTAALEACRYLS